jgi:hypothetical protein
MNADVLSQLTMEWFWPRATVGVAAGYVLRTFEHIVWASSAASRQTRSDTLRFAAMVIPQCLLIGWVVGYLLTAILAYWLRSATVINVLGYAAPALMAFLAADVRELLRRISRF